MEKQISKGLKNLFVIHYMVGGFLGLMYMIIPGTYAKLFQWPMDDKSPYRLIGAALCGFAASSWLSYRNEVWESVEISVKMEIVWCGLGAVVMAYIMFTREYPAIGWLNVAVFAFFAAAFGYFYKREK